ncbi:DUF1830 domain-containing protein [Baaleninema sp.]|uniref:DUF1830 domain-containing protein n=1 Tax=Baaleninema sp. TaxID=3101197 RepID=UPI003D025B80
MAQILDPLPKNSSNPILCCYINATSQIQVARITNIPNWYFERVVFPGQRLVFEALPQAQLEIHTGMMASSILSDTIPCDRLRVSTESHGMEDSTSKEDTSSVKNHEAAVEDGMESSASSDKEPALASIE